MAKQPDTPKPNKIKQQNEPEIIADSDVLDAEDAGAPKKTQLAKQSSQPTQLAKKSPQPTQLAPNEPQGPDTPPKAPRMEIDDADVVEAEAVESDVVEAQPASDVVEAQPVSDVVDAQPVSDVTEGLRVDSGATKASDEDALVTAEAIGHEAADQQGPETPVKSEEPVEVEEAIEDAIGGELPRGKAESSVRVKGKPAPELEATEMFEGIEQPAEDLERTAAFDAMGDDDSAVDLGRKPPKKSGGSQSGIDEVAEELESGVKLEAADSPALNRKPEPSVEFDDLVTEEGELPGKQPAEKSKKGKREDTTDPDMLVRKDVDEAAAADLLSDGTRTVEEAAADLWKETEELAIQPPKEEPSTPIPSKKKDKAPTAEAPAEEAAEETPAAPAPKRKAAGGAAVMTRPTRKPKYGRRWLGGMLVGILLAVGGLIGIRYYDPDLLEPAYAFLPEAKQPKAVTDSKAAQETAKRTREELNTVRAEKDELEKTIDSKTAEVKKLTEQVTALAASEKALGEVRDLLAKNMLIDAKADNKQLSKTISQALADKAEKDNLVASIEKALADAKLLEKLDPAAIGKLVKDVVDQQAALAAVNKALEDAMIKDSGAKGVQQLLTAKKGLDDKLTEINKLLGAEKIKSEGAAGLKEIVALRNQLQKDRDELNQAITEAYKELAAGQFVPATGNPRQQLLEGAKTARQRAESPLAIPLAQLATKLGNMSVSPAANTKNAFETAALMAELNYYRMREPLIQSPEQRLDTYLILYQRRGKGNPQDQAAALKDVAWVLSKDAKSSASAQLKAHAVRGFILRNQGKFAEARQALQAAAAAPAGSGWWADQAKTALAELTDPTVYYLPYIGELRQSGLVDLAKQELETALTAMPGDGRLLAQRALFQLEEARTTGKASPASLAAVRQDADAAMKNPKTAAEGTFVLGLLEEQLGNYAQAEQFFRQALKSHQGSADEAARYRIALARVLQRERTPTAAPAPPAKKDEKKANAAPEKVSQVFPLAAALIVGQVAPDEEENPVQAARLSESVKLAKELIASANPKIKGQGYMLLGQALAKQGLRTEGVREYMKGLEMLFPGMASKELIQLVNEHPAFQQADAAKAPSAYVAEVHFGKGLHYYWSGKYPEAEDEFRQASGFYSQDARYLYYLGLSQYAQKTRVKRDAAIFSFEKAAKLEADNRPSVAEINASLERVQGETRKMINSFRSKAIELRN